MVRSSCVGPVWLTPTIRLRGVLGRRPCGRPAACAWGWGHRAPGTRHTSRGVRPEADPPWAGAPYSSDMDTRWRRRPRRLDPQLADALVALGLFVLLVLSFGVTVRAGQRPVDAGAWVLGVLLTAPYAVHRRAPWLALTVTLCALVAFSLM